MGRYVGAKKESLERHRTQIERDGPFSQLPQEFMDEIMSTEFFQLAPIEGAETRDPLAQLFGN